VSTVIRVCFVVCLTLIRDWLRKDLPPLSILNQLVAGVFPRLAPVKVFALSLPDWFIVMFECVVIGQSDYIDICFVTIGRALYTDSLFASYIEKILVLFFFASSSAELEAHLSILTVEECKQLSFCLLQCTCM